MEETPIMASSGSPESIPSLDLSQVSTYSTEDEDSLKMVCEDTAKSSSKSTTFQHYAMFDIEEEDNISLSSGILSTTSLDLSFDQHSFASMETIKLQNSKETKSGTDPVFESVEEEEIPASRACHGALNITPKQLGDVFALFASETSKPNQAWPPPTKNGTAAALKKNMTSTKPASQDLSSLHAPGQAKANHYKSEGNPQNTQERSKQRLPAELFWKPRAKSLEKECAALKEIMRVDSSNIVKLKTAFERLERKSARYLFEIRALKEQLSTASRELNVLKREREMLLERETEHLETTRILKQEVDLLTRVTTKRDVSVQSESNSDEEELRQLRLENQLFASQIIEYEGDLNCISIMEKEQEQLKQKVAAMQKVLLTGPTNDQYSGTELLDEDVWEENGEYTTDSDSVEMPVEGIENQTRFSYYDPGLHAFTTPFPLPELSSDGVTDDDMNRSKERRQHLLAQLLSPDVVDINDETELTERSSDTSVDESEKHSSGSSSQSSVSVLKDHVVGMFIVGVSNENRKQGEQDKVYVLHQEESPNKETIENEAEIEYLQWQDPESPPSLVKMENITLAGDLEGRDPPETSLTQEQPCNPDMQLCMVPIRGAVKRHEISEDDVYFDIRYGTAIEVLNSGDDSSEAIEVQLSPTKTYFDDDNKENEGESQAYLCSSGCGDGKCDAWAAISDCLVFRQNDTTGS